MGIVSQKSHLFKLWKVKALKLTLAELLKNFEKKLAVLDGFISSFCFLCVR